MPVTHHILFVEGNTRGDVTARLNMMKFHKSSKLMRTDAHYFWGKISQQGLSQVNDTLDFCDANLKFMCANFSKT